MFRPLRGLSAVALVLTRPPPTHAVCVQVNHVLLPMWNLATSNLPFFLRNPMVLFLQYSGQVKAAYDRARSNWIVMALIVVVRTTCLARFYGSLVPVATRCAAHEEKDFCDA